MTQKISNLIEQVLKELSIKEKNEPDDKTYPTIIKQLEFVKECIENGKKVVDELNGRTLSFGIIASRNLSGSDPDLEEKIGEISTFVIRQ